MKKIYPGLLLLLLLLSCNHPQNNNNAYSFKVNGTTFTGTTYNAWYASYSYSFVSALYIGPMVNANYIQIDWSADDYITTGTYYTDSNYANNYNFGLTYINGTTDYPSVSGTIKVTQLDLVNHKVSGTFSFVGVNLNIATDTVRVTNGTFTNLTYIPQ